MSTIVKTVILVILAAVINTVAAPQPPVDAAALEKWKDDRFGLFIHWGLFSQTAGYWNGHRAKSSGHIMLYEKIPVKVWGELAADFNPVKFNADEWVLAAKNAGMKYLVYTTKHHDGLAMYHSPSSTYDIEDKSPFGRDPLKELADACHRHDIGLGLYYSLGRDWQDPDVPTDWPEKAGRSNTWDYPDEDAKVFNKYFERKVKPQLTELLTQYGKVDIIWFDTPEKISPEESAELRELILSYQPECIINSRIGNGMGDYYVREQKILKTIPDYAWESCITMARHWNYDRDEDSTYKSPELLVHQLLEITSKGGNYLLNVGPTAEGEFTQNALDRLKLIGDWMKINSEGIYATRPWKTDCEALTAESIDRKYGDASVAENMKDAVNDATSKVIPPEVRFTQKENNLYAFICRWDRNAVFIRSLGKNNISIKDVSLLGYDGDLKWEQSDEGLSIRIPEWTAVDGIPIKGLKVTLK